MLILMLIFLLIFIIGFNEGSHSANDGYAQCLYFTKFNKTVSQFELKQYTHFNSTVNHSNSDGWTSISVIW